MTLLPALAGGEGTETVKIQEKPLHTTQFQSATKEYIHYKRL